MTFIVLAKARNTIELEDIQTGIFGEQLLRGAQCGSIIRVAPQATGHADNTNRFFHVGLVSISLACRELLPFANSVRMASEGGRLHYLHCCVPLPDESGRGWRRV